MPTYSYFVVARVIMLKFKNVIVILTVTTLFQSVLGSFPSYITKCKEGDPNVNDCILNSIKAAVPQLSQGDKDLFIPNLNELKPDPQDLVIGNNVYSLRNINPESEELKPIHANMDFDTKTMMIGMYLEYLIWKADFKAKGEHLHASGQATIRFDKLQFNYTKHLVPKEIDGKTYLQIESEETTGTIDKIDISHNFDEETKPHCKEELKKNEDNIKKALEERLKALCSGLVTVVMNTVLKTTPQDEVFLHK